MKIKTNVFEENAKLISYLWNKVEGVYGGVYLDFEEKKAYLNVGTNKIDGRGKACFSFEYEGEAPKNFFVESSKLLSLAKSYDELEYDIDKECFFHGNDRFKIEAITPEDDFIDKSIFDVDLSEGIYFSEENMQKLNKAQHYTQMNVPEANPVFKTIFSENGTIFSLFDNQLFQAESDMPSMKMNNEAFASLSILSEKKKTMVSFYDNFVGLSNGDVVMLVPNNQNVEAPPVNSDGFIAGYDHDTYFSIYKDELLEVLKFMEFYYKENETKNSTLRVYQTEEGYLGLESVTAKDSILRTVTIDSTNIEGLDFYLDAEKLKKAVQNIDYPVIKIQWDNEKYAMNFTGQDMDGKETSNYHIVFSYMRG